MFAIVFPENGRLAAPEEQNGHKREEEAEDDAVV